MTVVIIGGGQAASQAAASLRQEGFAAPITILAEEERAPYQRPPLSKKFLEGALEAERLLLKPEQFYTQNSIDLRLGVRADAIDVDAKSVSLSTGEKLGYDKLIIATGSAPRELPVPGADAQGVFYLRSAADALALKPRLAEGKSIAIIGAGYVGLEVAATARKAGANVIIIETAPRVMSRVTGEFFSSYLQKHHVARGAKLLLDAKVARLETEDGRLVACAFANGEKVAIDTAVIGIGVMPSTDIAERAGIKCDNGVTVDEYCRTNIEGVFAAGDCTNHYNTHYDMNLRLESVHNAIEQAKTVAATICGKDKPYRQAPWFWSDQYDLKIQSVGVSAGHDDYFVSGNPEEDSFSVLYFSGNRLIAADCVCRPADYMVVRKLLQDQRLISMDDVKDADGDLKSLMARR
ncbi:MAG: FAD-dependent oxidoreductase [Alphaproteobacteria bacterium]|nr:FAD-dependent oxidoreductase [Alphaproteobacteria bacterium]